MSLKITNYGKYGENQMSQDKQLSEGDYILKDGAAWFTVSGFSVRVRTANDGSVICSIYNEGQEDGPVLGECDSNGHAKVLPPQFRKLHKALS